MIVALELTFYVIRDIFHIFLHVIEERVKSKRYSRMRKGQRKKLRPCDKSRCAVTSWNSWCASSSSLRLISLVLLIVLCKLLSQKRIPSRGMQPFSLEIPRNTGEIMNFPNVTQRPTRKPTRLAAWKILSRVRSGEELASRAKIAKFAMIISPWAIHPITQTKII